MATGKGDCYEACGKAIILGEAHGKLCHGEVFNPRTGRFHGHCWIENKVMTGGIVWVRDMSGGRDVLMPRTMYYEKGRVRRVTRYTPEEARLRICETEKWGPWPDSPADRAKSRQRAVSRAKGGESQCALV